MRNIVRAQKMFYNYIYCYNYDRAASIYKDWKNTFYFLSTELFYFFILFSYAVDGCYTPSYAVDGCYTPRQAVIDCNQGYYVHSWRMNVDFYS